MNYYHPEIVKSWVDSSEFYLVIAPVIAQLFKQKVIQVKSDCRFYEWSSETFQ